jgi:flavoprotein
VIEGTVKNEQVNPAAPAQGWGSASAGAGCVLADVLLVAPVHADTAAKMAAAVATGIQEGNFT